MCTRLLSWAHVYIDTNTNTMSCSICCEDFNSGARKEVSCGSCNYGACVACLKQYLLSTSQESHCPPLSQITFLCTLNILCQFYFPILP